MPFENSLVVIALKGEQIKEIADFIIADKKPHPLSGLNFYHRQKQSGQKHISTRKTDRKRNHLLCWNK